MLKGIQRNWRYVGHASNPNQASKLVPGRATNRRGCKCVSSVVSVSERFRHSLSSNDQAFSSPISSHDYIFTSSNAFMPDIQIHAAPFSTKSTDDNGGGEGAEALSELDFDSDNELGIEPATTDDDSINHLITNLYPNNPDPVLERILEASTIEQLFEAYESISDESERTPEQSSQGLACLWDLQKFIFQIGALFDPERDINNKRRYAEILASHPTFRKILEHAIENIKFLGDEPLAASLLCLKRLEFSVRSPECQAFLAELGKRKETLELPALSRLCVVLRNEGIYGSLLITEFFPRLSQLIREMDNNQGLRLASIALRSANRCAPSSFVQLYYDRVATLHKTNQLVGIDPSIYCKILLCLNDTKWIRSGQPREGASPEELQRIIGHLLTPFVNELPLMDVLSLQRILEFGPLEPPNFIQALNTRIGRLIEESQEEVPRLDLICCLAPVTRRSVEQRKRLASFVEQYLDSYPKFETISHLLLKILKTLKLSGDETRLYAKFWDKAYAALESGDPRKALKQSVEYLSFNFGMSYTFRHIQFEAKAKQLLYFYIYNYVNQLRPTLITPTDFAKAYAFLIAFSWHGEPIFQENSHGLLKIFQEKFAKGIRPPEFLTLARGISASLSYQGRNPRTSPRYFEQVMNFAAVVEGAMEDLLDSRDDLDVNEITSLTKAQLSLRKASDESDMFKKTVALFSKNVNIRNLDSKDAKEIATVLTNANFNEPAINHLLLNFTQANPGNITPEFVQRFLHLAYAMGLEAQSPEETSAFHSAHDVIERYWENLGSVGLIQSCLALSFAQSLQPPLVHNIFSVHFLNRLDEELKSSGSNNYYAVKLRRLYMELNRAVCLDLPDANVPWFHQKYCETLFSNQHQHDSPLEEEVFSSLGEVLDDRNVIQQDVFSPYFYFINFLIEFDKSGKPIKKGKPRRLLSLRSPSMEIAGEVGDRVGILILSPSSFTTNVRSLRGYCHLRKRHLEMLGYRIIQIDPQHWNSMFMTQLTRAEYLERVIFEKRDSLKGSNLNLNLI